MFRADLLYESAFPEFACLYPNGYICIMNTIIHSGPGYRVYFTQVGDVVYLLLCGGTKRGQDRDITRARDMARLLKGK